MTKRPALYVAVFFCLGIASCSFIGLPIKFFLAASAAGLTVSLIFIKNRNLSHVALYLAIFFAGMASYQNSFLAPQNSLPSNHISNVVSESRHKVYLRGTVLDDPAMTDTPYKSLKTTFVMDVSAYKDPGGWKDACGLAGINIYSSKKTGISYGDQLELEGIIYSPRGSRNPGTFDYRRYMKSRGIRTCVNVNDGCLVRRFARNKANPVIKAAYAVRNYTSDTIDMYFKAPYSGFLKAILIGERSGLDTGITDNFVKTGTVHVIAISGLHVGLIAGILMAIFAFFRVPRIANFLLSTVFLALYCIVAGANPPIVRAVIMFAVFAIGYVMERDADALNSLGLAAFLILLVNPAALFGPSFQLSFAAIASAILIAPRMDRLFGIGKKPRSGIFTRSGFYIKKSVSMSIAVFLGTWPIVAVYFNIVPTISVIANLIAVPVLFLLVIEAFSLIAFAALPGIAAQLTAKLTVLTESALFFANDLMAGLPLAYFRVASPTPGFLLLYYALLASMLLPSSMRVGRLAINKRHILITLLVLLNLCVWSRNTSLRPRHIRISFLDVGQGDSALLEFPQGGKMLIDAGPAGEDGGFDSGRTTIAPYLWNRGINNIDAMVITHPHLDHFGGAGYILENFKVGCIIDAGVKPESGNAFKRFAEAVKKSRTRHIQISEGDRITGFRDADIYILNPPRQIYGPGTPDKDINDFSVVLRIISGYYSAIFCADITESAIERIISSGEHLRAGVLKVPHHGSWLGSGKKVTEFFQKISPQISVISSSRETGDTGSYEKIWAILTSLGSKCYATNRDGCINVVFDHGRYFVDCCNDVNN